MKSKFLIFLLLSILFFIMSLIFKLPPKISCKIILLGLFLSLIQVKDLCHHCYRLTIVFIIIVLILKFLQYEFYISTGYDLGIFSSILHNIAYHGKIFDSLNQVHGFSGHVWPGAFLLAPLMWVWNDPRILLIVQTFAISMVFPATCYLGRELNVDRKYLNLLLIIIVFNIYLHRVSAFDFHPETLAMPMILFGIWALNHKKFILVYFLMLISMSLKEDIFLAWVSLGIYYYLIGKKKDGIRVLTFSIGYGVIMFLLILKFVNLKMMLGLHYNGNLNPIKRIKPTLEFFTSLGFLPLLSLTGITIFILPFLEHITSSRPLHYKLKCQYSTMLIPLAIFASLENLRKKYISPKILMVLTTLAVLFSINEGPIRKYINLSRINWNRKVYIDGLLQKIPQDKKVCLGNHISPHLSVRDGVYQFPTVEDAELIIIDTTWHDFTPLSSDSGLKILKKLMNSGEFKLVSDSLGIMVLRR